MIANNLILRWGFFGAGKVTNDFVSALSLLPKYKHKINGIAARSLERAKAFGDLHKIPNAFGSYKELASQPNIDIIYIGTTNSEHYENAKLAIQNGKHVLVEKPIGVNKKQVEDLVRFSREKNVFLMEGFWTRFFPAFKKLLKELKNGEIGEIVEIVISFGLPTWKDDRIKNLETCGGALINYGIYGIQLATLLLGKPDNIISRAQLMESGVDSSIHSIFLYNNGKTFISTYQTKCLMPGELFIVGTKGTLKLDCPSWAPSTLHSPTGTFTYDLPKIESPTNYPNSAGFIYEIEEIRDCISKGLNESPLMPLDESVLIYEICDEMKRQIGLKFPCDNDSDNDNSLK